MLADGEKIDAADHDHIMKMVEAKTVTVLRNGKDSVNIAIPDNFIFQLNDEKGFLGYRLPVHIAKVVNGEAAEKAGLKADDQLVSVAGVTTPSFTEFTAELLKNKGKEVEMGVIRNGQPLSVKITPSDAGKVGIQLKQITDIYPTKTIEYNFFQAIPKGIEMGCNQMVTYVSSLKYLFTSEGAQSLGGFGAIGDLFPESWSWFKFWNITAFLSVILAFMNILPIPALDGGHVLFTLYEIITRRKPSEKFLEYAQMVGMGLLFALLIYANANDIYRFFIK